MLKISRVQKNYIVRDKQNEKIRKKDQKVFKKTIQNFVNIICLK